MAQQDGAAAISRLDQGCQRIEPCPFPRDARFLYLGDPLAGRIGASEKGTRVLCDFLTIAGLVQKQGGAYRLTPEAAFFLDERSPAYFGSVGQFMLAPQIVDAYSDIAAVVRSVAPRPVNVLVGSDFATVSDLARLGVRRISVGGALARAAWSGFLAAAREIASSGTFSHLGSAAPFAEVNGLFGRDPKGTSR